MNFKGILSSTKAGGFWLDRLGAKRFRFPIRWTEQLTLL